MIAFIGDSFTWGQGLHYYYLTENKGWTWKDCELFYNSGNRYEWLGYEVDEYRKKNNFSALVSKELDLSFITPRMENGSDNYVTFEILENLQPFYSIQSLNCVVIQFSEPSRSILVGSEPKFETIEESIYHQIERINRWSEMSEVPWIGVSWMPEMGKILEDEFPNNFIPIDFENKQYNCFAVHEHQYLEKLTFSGSHKELTDLHFNSLGHKVMSYSILKKINSRSDIVKRIQQNKIDKNDIVFRG